MDATSQSQDGTLSDLLDREEPKTTNLDLIIEERLFEESQITTTQRTASRSQGEGANDSVTEEIDLDREDVITVKYLPFGTASRTVAECSTAGFEAKKVSQTSII